MVEWCSKCNTRILRSLHNSDIVHECNSGDDSLDTENVLLLGDWEDYTGSGKVAKSHQVYAGVNNELRGTLGGIMGGENSTRNVHGKRKDLYRTRKRLVYVDFGGKNG